MKTRPATAKALWFMACGAVSWLVLLAVVGLSFVVPHDNVLLNLVGFSVAAVSGCVAAGVTFGLMFSAGPEALKEWL